MIPAVGGYMSNLSEATALLHALDDLAQKPLAEHNQEMAVLYSSLVNLYDRADETTRFAIINGLAAAKLAIALPLFRQALQHDPNEVVRHEAAVALGNVGDSGSVPLLCAALRDSSSLVRHEAALALGDLGDETHLALLEKHLRQDDRPEAAISCRVAIAQIQHRLLLEE